MILEVAILDVIPEKTAEFEAHFEVAQEIISSMKGWLGINCRSAWKFQTGIFYSCVGTN